VSHFFLFASWRDRRCSRVRCRYRDDFKMQYEHFKSELAIFRLAPSAASRRFSSLVNFMSSVAYHYPQEASGFPAELMGVLDTHAAVLESETRTALVKALMALSAKRMVASVVLLPLCFKLFRVHDKDLRKLVYHHIVADIRRHNKNRRNVSLNKQLQNFMFTMLQDPSQIAQKKSLDVMVELYRRNIWRDAKTVNVMAQACLSEGKV
jgi:protein SDA1